MGNLSPKLDNPAAFGAGGIVSPAGEGATSAMPTMTGRPPTTWDFISSSFNGYWGNVGATAKGYFWNGPKNMIVGVGTLLTTNPITRRSRAWAPPS